MIDASIIPGIIKILLVCVIITAAYMISTRNLISLVSVYSLQSVTLACLALALYAHEQAPVLLAIAGITFLSKALIIPYFIATIQEKIRIKHDIEFHFLSPTSSLVLSMALMLVVYMALKRILPVNPSQENFVFFGAVIGLGYLSMENGVLLFGMFVTELPFIIEFLIIIDLIILVLLTTILTVGIDSTLEDYHKRLHRFHLLQGGEDRP